MHKLLLPLALLWLAGCASQPVAPPATDPQQSWQAHQQQLLSVPGWKLNGRLLLISEHETWNTSINWQQQDERYQIMISAPLGQGSLRLEGDLHTVSLQSHDGEAVQASDPELLLAQQLGWWVPLRALRYWVLGLPAPGDHHKQLAETGLLSALEQDGWRIEFRDYRQRDGVWLPSRIFATHPEAQVRLSIGQWQALR
ncbi:MAG: outer membrane lipoprotein LolB [Gammaproteobacteria bacterium]|nr:outer membrane lipoprotein LolB [Gammaproteobacteria bacterium]